MNHYSILMPHYFNFERNMSFCCEGWWVECGVIGYLCGELKSTLLD